MDEQQPSARDRLIAAGLDELNKYGPTEFSVRRVATACGVSCAAPYKHFENKSDFLAAIIEHANDLWTRRQLDILDQPAASTRQRLLLICRAYIGFLIENPYLRSALMIKDESIDASHQKVKSGVSQITQKMVSRYCEEVGMPAHVEQVKTFVVRSIIYGAALMLDNGELPKTEEFLDEIIEVIDREFDLP